MKKKLKKLLSEETIFLDLRADTKEGIITEMIDRLFEKGKISNRDAALKAIEDRERKMSTGMENGVAIPHGKTDHVDDLIAAIGRKDQGVDFNSMDGQPSKIFIMTISPKSHSGPHLQFLAEVTKALRDAETRERLIKARTVQEVIEIFI